MRKQKNIKITERDTKILSCLKDAHVGENDTDLFRAGLVALAKEKGVKVPA
jgi:hypothetical protein